MINKYFFFFSILIIFVDSFPQNTSVSPKDSNSISYYYKKGVGYLNKNNYIKALECFTKAHKLGMSLDSFYLLCSEVYLHSGALDTALVFNFGIKGKQNSDMSIKKYIQRAAIFSELGWEKEILALKDSLQNIKEYFIKASLSPLISLYFGSDYTHKKEKISLSFPYIGQECKNIFSGPGYSGNININWNIPLSRNMIVNLGTSAMNSSMYYRTSSSLDSVNILGGFNIGLKHQKIGAGIDYNFYRAIDYKKEYSTLNSLSFYFIKNSLKNYLYMSSGIDIELKAENKLESKRGWSVAYLNRNLAKNKTFSLLSRLSAYFAEPIIFNDSYRVMYVEDVSVRPVNHYYVDVLNQKSTLEVIPNSGIPYLLPTIYKNNSLIKSLEQLFGVPYLGYFSRNYISFSNTFGYKIPIIGTMFVSFFPCINLEYYPDNFSWTTFLINKAEHDTFLNDGIYNYIAFNYADGKYYWVKKLDNITSGEEYGPSVEFKSYTKQRIDLAFSFVLSLTRPLYNLGTITSSIEIKKNFSTLRKEKFILWNTSNIDAPFPVLNYSFGIIIRWNFDYNFINLFIPSVF